MTAQKISYSQTLLHICFAFFMLLLQKIGDNAEPFALALLYAMPFSSLSPLRSAFCYFCVSLFAKNILIVLLSAVQAFLLYLGYIL